MVEREFFNVVYQLPDGRRSWTTSSNINSFKADNPKATIIATGVEDERAIELCDKVPIQKHLRGMVIDSTDAKGNIDPFLLNLKLKNLQEAMPDRCSKHRLGN